MSNSIEQELAELRRKLDDLMKEEQDKDEPTFAFFEGRQLKLDLSSYLRSDNGKKSLDKALRLSRKFTPKPTKSANVKKPSQPKAGRLARAG